MIWTKSHVPIQREPAAQCSVVVKCGSVPHWNHLEFWNNTDFTYSDLGGPGWARFQNWRELQASRS